MSSFSNWHFQCMTFYYWLNRWKINIGISGLSSWCVCSNSISFCFQSVHNINNFLQNGTNQPFQVVSNLPTSNIDSLYAEPPFIKAILNILWSSICLVLFEMFYTFNHVFEFDRIVYDSIEKCHHPHWYKTEVCFIQGYLHYQ
jgi:hypothetical protein